MRKARVLDLLVGGLINQPAGLFAAVFRGRGTFDGFDDGRDWVRRVSKLIVGKGGRLNPMCAELQVALHIPPVPCLTPG